MDRLVAKICSDYKGFACIEVSILNSAGEQIEVYSGLPSLLPIKIFNKILTASSTFYVFSTVGLQENYEPENIVRNEFCWLTDPLPPVAESRTPYTLTLKWEAASFCGIEGELFFDSINYILEAAEGYEWQSGMVKNFVPDISEFDYKLICRGNMLLQAELVDLKPSTWYHFRVAIEYMGRRVYSESRAIPTSKAVPDPPGKIKVTSFESKHNDSSMRISWSQSKSNGSTVEKYQVRVLERHSGIATTTTLVGSSHGHSTSKEKTLSSKWRNVYCNLSSETSIDKPDDTVLDMKVKVRAKNSLGWSEFSEPLLINRHSFPNLFLTNQNESSITDPTSSIKKASNHMHEPDKSENNPNDVFYLYENALMKSLGDKSSAYRSTSSPQRISSGETFFKGERNELEDKIIDDELDRITIGLSINRKFVRNLIAPVIKSYAIRKMQS